VAGPGNLPMQATVTPDSYSTDHPFRGRVTFQAALGGPPTALGLEHVSEGSLTASLSTGLTIAGNWSLWAEFSNVYVPTDPDSGDGYYYDSNSDVSSLEVDPAPPASLQSFAPDSVLAGETFPMIVSVHDVYGNLVTDYTGTVLFTSSDPNAVLPDPNPYTFTPSDQGQHTFFVTLQSLGRQTVTATDTANPSLTTTSNVLVRGPAVAFAVSDFPALTQSGVLQRFSVRAIDPIGQTASDYTGTVHFTSSDGQAILPADYTFTTADGGVHSFSATLETSGLQSLTATDTTTGFTGTQQGIIVTPARLMLGGFPSPVPAGSSNSFTVQAVDAAGQPDIGYTGTVHFSSSDRQATLPADYTFTSSDAGHHTFSGVILRTASQHSITATDTMTASLTGMQSGIQVTPGPVARLRMSGFPASVHSGTSFNFTVAAIDSYANVVPSYSGRVAFRSSDRQASLPADYTFTPSDRGVHTFMATLQTLGVQSITAFDQQSNLTAIRGILVTNPGGSPGPGGSPPPGKPGDRQPDPAPPPDPGTTPLSSPEDLVWLLTHLGRRPRQRIEDGG
jgi:hypothetical protein